MKLLQIWCINAGNQVIPFLTEEEAINSIPEYSTWDPEVVEKWVSLPTYQRLLEESSL